MSVKNPNKSAQNELTVNAASIEVMPYHGARTAVTFGAIAGTVFVSKKNPATITNGLPIIAGTVPFTLCQCHGGDWVKGPLYAIADGAARTLIIIEGFEPAGAGEFTYAEE